MSVGKDFVLAAWSRASAEREADAMANFFAFYLLACVATIFLQVLPLLLISDRQQ